MRPPGILETTPRQAKLPTPTHTQVIALTHSETAGKWLVFDHTVYCIGEMESPDYQKWVRSFAKNQFMVDILLKGIDDWGDSWARWYTALELLKRGKIVLYNSRAEAEQAMEVRI